MWFPASSEVSTAFCAPLPLAGRGWGWGSTRAVPMPPPPSLTLPRKGGGNSDIAWLPSPSGRFRRLRQRGKGLAFGGEALEQRRRLERGIAGFPGVERQPVGDVL